RIGELWSAGQRASLLALHERDSTPDQLSVREPHGQRLQLVDEQRLRREGIPGERDVGVALERLLDQDAQLQPCERRAQAEVPSAGAERLVLGVAADIEMVGVLVARLVAV